VICINIHTVLDYYSVVIYVTTFCSWSLSLLPHNTLYLFKGPYIMQSICRCSFSLLLHGYFVTVNCHLLTQSLCTSLLSLPLNSHFAAVHFHFYYTVTFYLLTLTLLHGYFVTVNSHLHLEADQRLNRKEWCLGSGRRRQLSQDWRQIELSLTQLLYSC
jgi:hypothetical protein